MGDRGEIEQLEQRCRGLLDMGGEYEEGTAYARHVFEFLIDLGVPCEYLRAGIRVEYARSWEAECKRVFLPVSDQECLVFTPEQTFVMNWRRKDRRTPYECHQISAMAERFAKKPNMADKQERVRRTLGSLPSLDLWGEICRGLYQFDITYPTYRNYHIQHSSVRLI